MDTWQEWIGRQHVSQAWLDPQQANRMAATLDHAPCFQDGDQLPPAWHWLYTHDIARASELGPDGHPRLGLFMPPIPLPRRMWAGGRLSFISPLRLGEMVMRRTTIRAIEPKQGRSGALYFVSVEHTLSVGGEIRLEEQQTIVYREHGGVPADQTPLPAPQDYTYEQHWQLDSTALFRYSALTFNGHRIHYDADYCRAVEGYPGLVVHGPLIATLLLDLYLQHAGEPGVFRYRARQPLFLPQPLIVRGKAAGTTTQLWASDHTGKLVMDAEVSSPCSPA